jgi:hypothetical protein
MLKHNSMQMYGGTKSKDIAPADLVLRQGYVLEKRRANRTQNSHLKQCISWGLGE